MPHLSNLFLSLTTLFAFFVTYCLYKIYRHPLASIPGPFLAKLTHARFFYHTWKGDLHLDHVKCHREYGPVYRSGPSRVVFNTMSAALAIYTTDRTITKAPGYASHPFTRDSIPSLFNCIDADRAGAKKKLIRPTTTAPAMALQYAAIEENVERFVEIVRDSKVRDLSQLAFYYALDVISLSMFGASFDTMRDPTHRWMCLSLERGNKHMYMQLAWPALFTWLSPILDIDRLTYPEFHEESKMFLDLCMSHLQKGQQEKEKGAEGSIYDFMKGEKPEGISQAELYVDAFSFMRGGGDMVAVTIAAALFYITQDDDVLAKLTEEIRTTFEGATPAISPKLDSCKYLRACIDEALRMVPPGPGVFWRTSPTDVTIDGVHLPAGTDFGVPVFALHFNEDVFPDPCSFRPERFLEGGAREKFIPFLRGFRSCPAQKHAYSTILLPVARLVWEFDLVKGKSSNPSVHAPGVKELYEELYGSAVKKLYLQTDVFGSRIEGPILQCLPRK